MIQMEPHSASLGAGDSCADSHPDGSGQGSSTGFCPEPFHGQEHEQREWYYPRFGYVLFLLSNLCKYSRVPSPHPPPLDTYEDQQLEAPQPLPIPAPKDLPSALQPARCAEP